jgi:hypothetical protein
MVYENDESGWEAATSGLITTIDFESIDVGTGFQTTIGGGEFSGLPGGPTLTGLPIGSVDTQLAVGIPSAGFFIADFVPVSGSQVFSPQLTNSPDGSPTGIVRVDFVDPVLSFGAWFLDVEQDYASTGFDVGGHSIRFSENQGDNSQSFLGFIADAPVYSLEIHLNSTSGGNGIGLDDIKYSTTSEPVPEPTTMLLLGTGLAGILGMGRKKFIKHQ